MSSTLYLSQYLQVCSLIFLQFLSCNLFCVDVVTLAGLAFSCLASLLTLLSNPQLDKPHVYQSHHLISGICIFMYQTLDNMDGKQARRTSSSSPLGMLFDHGCDAINATVLCIPISSALSTEWSMGIFFALWCGYVPFFFQTWEEYYLGEMVLPCINGTILLPPPLSYSYPSSEPSYLRRPLRGTAHRCGNMSGFVLERTSLVASALAAHGHALLHQHDYSLSSSGCHCRIWCTGHRLSPSLQRFLSHISYLH